MGFSTDGNLSFGYKFEEDYVFPWDEDQYGGDIVDWWRDQLGFKNPVENPFTDEGNYKPGLTYDREIVREYFRARRDFDKENPVPVVLVNYCSGECPMYIITLPEFTFNASRGYPTEIEGLPTTRKAEEFLTSFVERFNLEPLHESPLWWLSSNCD